MLFVSLAVAITFVQEQLLVFLPNVQFTILLIFVFSSVFSLKESVVYVITYVILDNLYMGGFQVINVVPMLFAWNLIPLSLHTWLKTRNELKLAFAAFGFAFIYSWSFLPGVVLLYGLKHMWSVYLLADLPFEAILAGSGFLSVLWLYQPLRMVLVSLLGSDMQTNRFL